MKRLMLGVASSLLLVGGIAVTGSMAGALKAPPAVLSGGTTCNINGAVSFSPPLVTGGTSATTVTLHASLTGCTNNTTGAPAIGTGHLAPVTGSLATNDCATLESGTLPTLGSGTVRWTPTARIASSTGVTLGTAAGSTTATNQIQVSFTGGTVGGGSFAGDSTSATITSVQNTTQLGERCSTALSVVHFKGTATL